MVKSIELQKAYKKQRIAYYQALSDKEGKFVGFIRTRLVKKPDTGDIVLNQKISNDIYKTLWHEINEISSYYKRQTEYKPFGVMFKTNFGIDND